MIQEVAAGIAEAVAQAPAAEVAIAGADLQEAVLAAAVDQVIEDN